MAPLSFHDKQHLQRVLAQQQNIAAIFNRFIESVSPHLRKWMDAGKSSVWVRNGAVENVIDRELVKLQAELMNNLSAFQMDAWKRSGLKNDQMINQFIEGISIRPLTKEGMFGRNMEALQQLQNRVDNGMNLSDKIWNIANQTKKQLEFYLGSGVSVGQGAGNISRDVRQLLDHPDTRFRRIRNADGELIPSKPMQDYHPGSGVYRSAKMNALRMAATETNTAYRKSDHERWNKLDFVLGFIVKRSGNNKGPCSMCDALTGEYPKEFIFAGWHPFCLCVATPILMNHDDFADYLLNNTVPQGYILDIPVRTRNFIGNNRAQVNNAYWMQDNFINGDVNKPRIEKALILASANSTSPILVKERSKKLKEWAKDNIAGTYIEVEALDKKISITTKGIKEFLNQPHKHYQAKNEIIKSLSSILKNAEYKGCSNYHKENPMFIYSHIFEIELNGEKSWIIAREDKIGNIVFHSISDSENVLKGVKK